MEGQKYSYDKIYTFENLYKAFRQSAKGKRHKKEVIDFELDLARNLWRLHEELKSGAYRISGYYQFRLYDPKIRNIQALHFRDRVVQHSLCDNVLREYFENRLIYDCAACRRGKGTHFAMRRLTEFFGKFYAKHGTDGYILKIDIRKYFDNIDHEVLKKRLSDFPDEKVRNLLLYIVDSQNQDTGKGLPLGNQTSQWFALYYLDPIDRLIKEKYRIKYYTRYMDDLVMIHEDKEYLKEVLTGLRDYAENVLKLEFNEKTQIFPISQGVDYLGWHFYLTDSGKVIKRLRRSNKRRFKRRMKAFAKKYSEDDITLEEIKRSLAAYNGHLKHGHTWKLKKRVYSGLVLKKSEKNDAAPLKIPNIYIK